MSLRIDGGYKKTATISDEQKIYELSQIWKDAEYRYYSMLPVYLVKIGDEFTVLSIEKDAEVTMKEALIIIDVQNDYFPGGSCELYRPLEAYL